MTEDYKQKYLKYKQKYLEFKSQIGGLPGYPFTYATGGTIAIMANITGDVLDNLIKTTDSLRVSRPTNLHITLLHLHINFANKSSHIFLTEEFNNVVKKSFINNIRIPGIELESLPDSCDIFGQNPSFEQKYWVNTYSLPLRFKENISKFRMDIYNYLNTKVSIGKPTFTNRNDTDFVIYYANGIELYAVVKNQYFKVDTWKPHISIILMKELLSHNKGLFDEIKRLPNNTAISKKLVESSICSFSNIKMNSDIKKLIISIRWNGGGLNKSSTLDVDIQSTLKADTPSFTPKSILKVDTPAFTPKSTLKVDTPSFTPTPK